MTEGIVGTKGTRLYFAVSDSEILKVACPTGISGLGGAASKVDTTCLDSEREESFPGTRTNNPLTIPINFINRSASHQALIALEQNEDQPLVAWLLVDSDQQGTPTALDSDGFLVSPGPTTKGFKGYVDNIEYSYELNNVKRATLTIQPSGGFIDDLPTADLP